MSLSTPRDVLFDSGGQLFETCLLSTVSGVGVTSAMIVSLGRLGLALAGGLNSDTDKSEMIAVIET